METKNTPTETSPIETALAEQNITAQVIAKLKTDYSGLKINGIDDKQGFEAVEKARKECKADEEDKKQAELALGDKPKFEKMLQELEYIKTKYEFKAAKYKTVQNSVNGLIDKTITYAKTKI